MKIYVGTSFDREGRQILYVGFDYDKAYEAVKNEKYKAIYVWENNKLIETLVIEDYSPLNPIFKQ